MITEKSCGAVVYTEDHGNIQYVVIRSKNGIYGFPKGHMEGAESEEETALREILEETGLKVNLTSGFKIEDTYTYVHNGEKRTKCVVYFLGEYSNQLPIAQETELESVQLTDYDKALDLFQFENLKRLLKEAHKFLTEHSLFESG